MEHVRLPCGKEATGHNIFLQTLRALLLLCLSHAPLIIAPSLSALSPSFHFCALTFPIAPFFVLAASFTSVILHPLVSFQPPFPLVSFYLLSPPLCRSPLSGLPPALFLSTFEASLVGASNKLYIWQDVGKVSSSVCSLLASTYGSMLQHERLLLWTLGDLCLCLLYCAVSCHTFDIFEYLQYIWWCVYQELMAALVQWLSKMDLG